MLTRGLFIFGIARWCLSKDFIKNFTLERVSFREACLSHSQDEVKGKWTSFTPHADRRKRVEWNYRKWRKSPTDFVYLRITLQSVDSGCKYLPLFYHQFSRQSTDVKLLELRVTKVPFAHPTMNSFASMAVSMRWTASQRLCCNLIY